MNDVFDELSPAAEQVRARIGSASRELHEFTRRIELILSQDQRKIPIRDTAFSAEFAAFCTQLRGQMDDSWHTWQQLREQLRSQETKPLIPSSLQSKSFTLRAKTLSRACDEFTTAYDRFNYFYKNYTLAKLPVWVLTACCEDMNNLTGKILFLAREVAKRTAAKGDEYVKS